MTQRFSSHTLPHYVREFTGGGEHGYCPDLYQLKRGVWLISGKKRGLVVRADTAPGAREAIRSFVSRIAPKTDKRRSYWVYT